MAAVLCGIYSWMDDLAQVAEKENRSEELAKNLEAKVMEASLAEEELRKARQHISLLESELAKSHSLVEMAKGVEQDNQRKLARVEGKVVFLETELRSVKEERDVLREVVRNRDEKITALETEVDQLEDDLGEAREVGLEDREAGIALSRESVLYTIRQVAGVSFDDLAPAFVEMRTEETHGPLVVPAIPWRELVDLDGDETLPPEAPGEPSSMSPAVTVSAHGEAEAAREPDNSPAVHTSGGGLGEVKAGPAGAGEDPGESHRSDEAVVAAAPEEGVGPGEVIPAEVPGDGGQPEAVGSNVDILVSDVIVGEAPNLNEDL